MILAFQPRRACSGVRVTSSVRFQTRPDLGWARSEKNGNDILKQVVRELGEDDPITNEFLTTMAVYQSAKKNMSAFVEKGKMIEEFDLDALETTSSS